jgi:signal transduction histidine kinase/ActR/RegA family two-component response regulator
MVGRPSPADPTPAFLSGGGEMGERIRAHDWAATPLGAASRWPPALKTLVALMLASEQPMFIAWGARQTWLYNDAFVPILGAKHPAALARPALAEVWNEAYAVLAPLFERVFAGEPVRMNDFGLMLDRNGRLEEAHFAFSYTPVRDDSGSVAGLFGACIETTDRILASRREVAALERQRQMFEQAPSFVCMLAGPEHVFEFVNRAHRELFNSGEWIGKPVREAFTDLAGQGYYELLDEVYRTGKRHIGEAAMARFRRVPGGPMEDRLLTFVYEPVVDAAGHVTGIFCEGSDVTDMHRAQQALRESESRLRDADRRKDEFLATLAHELRNPLAPLRSALYLVQQGAGGVGSPGMQALHGMMERQVDQMVRLVDDLLDVARITQGKTALRVEPVDMARVVQNAVETTAPGVKQAGCEIEVSLPSGGAWVSGDAVRLTQVLSNLIGNAVKFSGAGDVIRVAVARDGDAVEVSVTDSGIGIPADKLEEVFEMFAQLEPAVERSKSGLGLGLALARQFVRMHGGTIRAQSPGPGQGSVFTVRLPSISAAGAEADATMKSAADGGAELRRILVADDNHDAADSMGMLLTTARHEVEVVYDGIDALEVARRIRPEVMVVDIGMPRMNGYDLARAVRGEPWSRDTLIIALTGWGQESDRLRSMEAGVDVHLVKPVERGALEAAVLRKRPSLGR